MKLLVPTKRVPDTDYKIRVKEDGSGIDEQNLPYVINPFDAIALEEALRIREASADEVEVVILGIGGSDDYEKELRSGLAMGADRGILVSCEPAPDPWNVARILHAVVAREQPDLVIVGKQAVDDDSNQAGQFLAALLDWPQATFASKVAFGDDGVTVDRETDTGIERVRVTLPCVITADLRLNEPRYASLPNIMKAKKKPIDRLTLEELGVELEPRVQVLDLSAPSSKRTCVKVEDVDALLAKLRDEAKVL